MTLEHYYDVSDVRYCATLIKEVASTFSMLSHI